MIGPLDMVSLLAVLLIGVPHGAADAGLAMTTRFADNRAKLAGFMLAYIAAAALVIGFWHIAPLTALTVFLAMTVYHFGRGDALAYGRGGLAWRALLHGGFIMHIALAHPDEVSGLFRLLTHEAADIWPLMSGLHVAFLLWLALFGMAIMSERISLRAIGEISALMALAWLTPPLVAFAVYFCGVHSARHFARLAADERFNTPQNKKLAAGLAVIAIAAIAAIAIAAAFPDAAHFGDSLMRSLFIGLAALTVPHMLLIDGLDLVADSQKETRHATA